MGLTFGQLVGSIGGGIIGGIVGGPQGFMIGMALGGTVGGWIDPPPAPPPPPLGDIGLNSYVHNAPVALAYGQNKVVGGCIMIGDMGAEYDGKDPYMWIKYVIAHCEGPVISYIKYWVNDKDIDEAAAGGMKFIFTSYLGTSIQSIDPYIATYLSGAEAGAIPFRYTAYTYVYGWFSGGFWNTVPNIAAEIKCFLTETGEEDANPIRVLYDYLTDEMHGAELPIDWFDGDPDTVDSSWKIATDYCDETVSYEDGDGVTQYEPRFRYSNVFNQRTKGYDIARDILSTCRGIIAWSQGKFFVKIENASEPIDGYFTDEYIVDFIATGSSTVNRVYFSDTIDEPDGFWEGAYLQFKINNVTYSEMVYLQGTDYVDLVDDLPIAPPNLTDISLTKDNIKEGTFEWNKTPKSGRYNSIRIEFINRKWWDENKGELTNQYLEDVVEHEQPDAYSNRNYGYDPDKNISDLIQQQIRLQGIKRKSQAMRMAKWFADFSTYCIWYCEFVTDSVGYIHKIGDIIAVSHSQIGWKYKEFRIVSMEEVEHDEIKLSCLEYNRFIYSDDINPVYNSTTTVMPSLQVPPDDTERVHVVQDITENKIWVNFKKPDDNNWWTKGQVWIKKGAAGEYEVYDSSSKTTSSVKLDTGGIDASQTTIPYDNSTLYGSFPSSGSFWIEDELITYTGFSGDPDYEFTGCVRGTNASVHTADKYCHKKESTLPNVSFLPSEVGNTWYFKILSMNVVGVSSDFDDATEVSIILA